MRALRCHPSSQSLQMKLCLESERGKMNKFCAYTFLNKSDTIETNYYNK